MRVILVGDEGERERLHARIDGAVVEVIGEFSSLAAARASGLAADAIMLAPAKAADFDEAPMGESLTPREIQVLELLAEGLSNKAIAATLGVSDQTVKFHVASISGKLGASNRTDAVRLAVRRGLITM
jgi:DNA-binding NarL/FixJ family response regulator